MASRLQFLTDRQIDRQMDRQLDDPFVYHFPRHLVPQSSNKVLVCFDSLRPSQQFFRYVGMGLPELNQYLSKD